MKHEMQTISHYVLMFFSFFSILKDCVVCVCYAKTEGPEKGLLSTQTRRRALTASPNLPH